MANIVYRNTKGSPLLSSEVDTNFQYLKNGIGGVLTKPISTNVTLTDDESDNHFLSFTGALTTNVTVSIPATKFKDWEIYNGTTGGFLIYVKCVGDATTVPCYPNCWTFIKNANGSIIAENDFTAINPSTLSYTGSVSTTGTVSMGSQFTFRNKIINGNFDIWQRGSSLPNAVHNEYLADRWVSVDNGCTTAITQLPFILGQTTVPNNPTYYHRTIVTSVIGAGNYSQLIQRIEDVTISSGKTYTLSFWGRADSSKNIAVEFTQVFGTGGTPSAPVTAIGVTTVPLSNGWGKFTITVNFPSITGKTLGTSNDDHFDVHFWFNAGSNYNTNTNSLGQQSGTFDIAQVQLEEGDTATTFETLPPSVIAYMCRRYYQTITDLLIGGYHNAGNAVHWQQPLPVSMRRSPRVGVPGTIVYSNASGYTINVAYPDTIRGYIIIGATNGYGYGYNSGITLDAEF